MWEDILEGQLVLNFNGHVLEADTFLLVEGEDYNGPTVSRKVILKNKTLIKLNCK